MKKRIILASTVALSIAPVFGSSGQKKLYGHHVQLIKFKTMLLKAKINKLYN